MNQPVRYKLDHFVEDCKKTVQEILPWDIEDILDGKDTSVLILDIREPYEHDKIHIKGSLLVPRGVLEISADYGFNETVEELVEARDREIIVVCSSGLRSILASRTLQLMGFNQVKSLQSGLRGCSDAGYPLYDKEGNEVSEEEAEAYFYQEKQGLFRH